MEPQQLGTPPPIQTTATSTPIQSNNSGVTGGDIFKTLVHSFICGFAIGLGVILAVKMAGKKVVLKDNKTEGTTAMNGYSPMYQSRNMPQNGRLPYPPNMMQQQMMQRPPYMMITGGQVQEKFNVSSWVKRSPESPLVEYEFLGEVKD